MVIGVVVAYLTGRTLGPGKHYLQVFRVAGTVAAVKACDFWTMLQPAWLQQGGFERPFTRCSTV